MSDSVRPHRRQPTRLPRPWDFPGKNTGVGCHFLLQCMKVKSESEVVQSCLTLSDPMDCSLPGSSVHGIFQAEVLEWGAISFSLSSLNCPLKNPFLLFLSYLPSASSFPFPFPDFLFSFFLLLAVCMLSHLSCVQLCELIDCSLPGFSVHGMSQAKILEWVAISSSRGSSQPRSRTCISYSSCIDGWVLYH